MFNSYMRETPQYLLGNHICQETGRIPYTIAWLTIILRLECFVVYLVGCILNIWRKIMTKKWVYLARNGKEAYTEDIGKEPTLDD